MNEEEIIKVLEDMFFEKESFEPIGYIETFFTIKQQEAIQGLLNLYNQSIDQRNELATNLSDKEDELKVEKDRNIELTTTIDALNTDLETEKEKNNELEKVKLMLFMVVRNSKVLPKGLELLKTNKEITDKTKETIKEIEKMINFEKAREFYNL